MRNLFSLSTFCAALLAGGFFAVSPAKAETGDAFTGDAFTGAYVSGEISLTSGLEQEVTLTDNSDPEDPETGMVSGDPFSFGASLGYGVMASEIMGDAMGDTMGDMPIYLGGEISAFFSLFDEDLGDINVEESWNIQIAGDVGYVVQEDILAFVRIGYLFGGAESNLTNDDGDDLSDSTVSDAEDSSFLIGIGGAYALPQGFNVRGMVVRHLGDRSGTEFRLGAAWRF